MVFASGANTTGERAQPPAGAQPPARAQPPAGAQPNEIRLNQAMQHCIGGFPFPAFPEQAFEGWNQHQFNMGRMLQPQIHQGQVLAGFPHVVPPFEPIRMQNPVPAIQGFCLPQIRHYMGLPFPPPYPVQHIGMFQPANVHQEPQQFAPPPNPARVNQVNDKEEDEEEDDDDDEEDETEEESDK